MQSLPSQDKPGAQINALTSTRAVAAIMVVIHHYGKQLFPFNQTKNLFQSGNLAVSYFFVLSGFVLFVAHWDREVNYITYLRRRAGRILPLYYVALAAVIALMLWQGDVPLNMKRQVAYSVLLIQSYMPGYALTLNGPAWSISVEMLFYLLFPWLLWLMLRHLKVFAALWVVLFVTAQALHMHYFEQRHSLPDAIVDPLFFGPYTHMSQFMTGMIGGYIYNKMRQRPQWPWYVPPVVAVITFTLIACRPDNISYHVGLIAPVFMLLIIAIAKVKAPIMNLPVLVFMGEISYGIYILQAPVYRGVDMFFKHYMPSAGEVSVFWSSMVVLIVLSAILYKVLEQPLRRVISGTTK